MRKDYRLEVRVRNANLLRAMEENGFANAAELSRASGVSQQVIGRYLAMTQSPYKVDGSLSINAVRLEKALRRPIDMLFSEKQARTFENTRTQVDISLEQAMEVSRGYAGIDEGARELAADAINAALSRLRPRDAEILRRRFGIGRKEMTYDEIGREYDVTRERVRQIEAHAVLSIKSHFGVPAVPAFARKSR